MKLKYKGSAPEVQRVRGKKKANIDIVDEKESTDAGEQEPPQSEVNRDHGPMGGISNISPEGPPKVGRPAWELKVLDFEENIVAWDGFNLNSDES
jgi:hypothetical protein